MSGTYQLDGELFPQNPIAKRWSRQPIAVAGAGETIYSAFWQIELSFGILDTTTDVPFFEGKWLGGGLHTAVLPHPETAQLVQFTGTNIQDFSYELNDVDSDGWAEGGRLIINHINLGATGA